MTVAYASDVTQSQNVLWIHNLLLRWKGSVYKLILSELIGYIIIYVSISCIYRYLLDLEQKRLFQDLNTSFRMFEYLVRFCDTTKNSIPLSFLIGFFVAAVVARWWQLFTLIPWLNKIAFLIQCLVIGRGKEKSTKIRLVLIRYINLAWILLMRQVSGQVRNRFQPCQSRCKKEMMKYTTTEILDGLNKDPIIRRTFGKIISEREIDSFQQMGNQYLQENPEEPYEPEYWIPLRWASRLLNKSQKYGLIYDLRTASTLIVEIENLREQMQLLLIQSKILLPLVYTQVVIIVVYSYFFIQIMTSLFLESDEHSYVYFPLNFPVLSIFEFIFIMGWLKVAMCVMNPFGEDDEDFQTSAMLDYNLNLSYRCATAHDDMYPDYLKHPNIVYTLNTAYITQKPDLNESKSFFDSVNVIQSELAREYAAFQSEICQKTISNLNNIRTFLRTIKTCIPLRRKREKDQLSLYSTRRYSFNDAKYVLHPRAESQYYVISVDESGSRL